MLTDELMDRIERTEQLDRIAEPVQGAVRGALSGGRTSYALAGAWLGHAVHPLLTDMVIGPWASAWLLDLLGGEAARPAARRLVGIGILASLPTAATGAHDWADEATRSRRAGLVHALANSVGLGLQVGSWLARRGGRHGRAVGLSTAAMAAVGVGGFIGGHMSYVLGAGVSRTAFQSAPEDWTPTVAEGDVGADPVTADVDGTPVLLVRDGGVIRAIGDTCSHAGCSLSEGEVRDGSVVCPCHGSRFALRDGAVEAGPAHTAQPSFEARVTGGVVEVRESRTP